MENHVYRNCSWLAQVDGELDNRMAKKGLGVPNAVVTVRQGEVSLPLCNTRSKDSTEVILEPGDAQIRLRSLDVKYRRTYYDGGHSGNNRSIILQVDPLGNEIIKEPQDDETQADTNNDTVTSELPSIVTVETGTEFQMKPDIRELERVLKPEVMKDLEKLLDDFNDLLWKNMVDIGSTHLPQHDVKVEEGAQPARETSRCFPPPRKDLTDDQVRNLLEDGLTDQSRSHNSSGMVCVKKTDGTWRLCMDVRRLRSVQKKDSFPLPRIHETTEKLGNAQYFTTLDLGCAFQWWRSVSPFTSQTRKTNAFTTCRGRHPWSETPFGPCGTTATFRGLRTTKVLDKVVPKYGNLMLRYMDNIIIASATQEDHVKRLKEAFQALVDTGLKLKAETCKIFSTHMRYLGKLINADEIRLDPDALEALEKWKTPTSIREVATFLAFIGYYREFVKDYTTEVMSLQKMMKKDAIFEWTEKQQTAFDRFKEILLENPILALPQEDGEFVLETYASNTTIAGTLLQYQEYEGTTKLRVISYTSRKLNECQRRYETAKLEMFAVVQIVEKFSQYLSLRKFKLRVDLYALSWLNTHASEENSIAARWLGRLNGFYFEAEQRVSEEHQSADRLRKRALHLENENQESVANNLEYLPFWSAEQQGEIPSLSLNEDTSTCTQDNEENLPKAHTVSSQCNSTSSVLPNYPVDEKHSWDEQGNRQTSDTSTAQSDTTDSVRCCPSTKTQPTTACRPATNRRRRTRGRDASLEEGVGGTSCEVLIGAPATDAETVVGTVGLPTPTWVVTESLDPVTSMVTKHEEQTDDTPAACMGNMERHDQPDPSQKTEPVAISSNEESTDGYTSCKEEWLSEEELTVVGKEPIPRDKLEIQGTSARVDRYHTDGIESQPETTYVPSNEHGVLLDMEPLDLSMMRATNAPKGGVIFIHSNGGVMPDIPTAENGLTIIAPNEKITLETKEHENASDARAEILLTTHVPPASLDVTLHDIESLETIPIPEQQAAVAKEHEQGEQCQATKNESPEQRKAPEGVSTTSVRDHELLQRGTTEAVGSATSTKTTRPLGKKKRKSEVSSLTSNIDSMGKMPSRQGFQSVATRSMVSARAANVSDQSFHTARSRLSTTTTTCSNARTNTLKRPESRNTGGIEKKVKTTRVARNVQEEPYEQHRIRSLRHAWIARELTGGRIGNVTISNDTMLVVGGQHMFFDAPINLVSLTGFKRTAFEQAEHVYEAFKAQCSILGEVARVAVETPAGVNQLWLVYTHVQSSDESNLLLYENGIAQIIQKCFDWNISHLATLRPPYHPTLTRNWTRAADWLDKQFEGTGIEITMYTEVGSHPQHNDT